MNKKLIEQIQKVLEDEPNLMAKEILKLLQRPKTELTKTELNRLLYDQKDILFEVDSTYKWRLISSKAVTVSFQSQWINCNTFENSLKESALNLDSASSVIFVLPKNCKFLLESSARLLAVCNQLVKNETKVTIDLTENAMSLHYLNRAGFFDQLHLEVTVLPNRPVNSTAKTLKGNSINLVEFGTVDPAADNKDLVDQLTKAFVTLSSSKYGDAAFTIFAELIGNIKEHSKSQLQGFAALQRYEGFRGKPHIQTIVSDSGLGIAATLRPSLKKHYPHLDELSDIELVKNVMSNGGVTRKQGQEEGRGLGFKSSKEKASKFNATYSVRQKDFSLTFQYLKGKLQPINEETGLTKILGTHICFDFDID